MMKWPRYALRELAPAIPSRSTPHPGEAVWHLGLDQIESHTGIVLTKNRGPLSEAGNSTFHFDRSHVLYSKLRPYLNKVVVPDEPGIATTELIPLQPRPHLVNREFLAYYLRSPMFLAYASRYVTGAKMPRVILDRFWAHEVPLPPLSEQRRTVEILDQADRLRRLRTEATTKAERILPALFIKMFGDPGTNPMGWPKRPLGELATVITGNTPSRKKQTYFGDYIEWVKSNNLNTPLTLHHPHVRMSFSRRSKSRQDSTVGLYTSNVYRWQPKRHWQCSIRRPRGLLQSTNQCRGAAIRGELLFPLRTFRRVGKPLVQAASTGGMKGIVTKSRFCGIQFLAPPFELQEGFGHYCKRLCEQTEFRLKQACRFNGLYSLLLQRAFSGNLTKSWREAYMEEQLHEVEQQADLLSPRECEP